MADMYGADNTTRSHACTMLSSTPALVVVAVGAMRCLGPYTAAAAACSGLAGPLHAGGKSGQWVRRTMKACALSGSGYTKMWQVRLAALGSHRIQ